MDDINSLRPSALLHNYPGLDRSALLKCYLADVALDRLTCRPTPEHPLGVLRVMQWNINNLLGPKHEFGHDIQMDAAREVSNLVRHLNVDVVVLQECGGLPEDIDDSEKSIGFLATELRHSGYMLMVSKVCFPTLLATRLPTKFTSSIDLDGDRGAVFAQVEAFCGTSVSIYATHFDCNDSQNVRLCEATMLLAHQAETVDPLEVTLVVGDFNQPRRPDYLEEEWKQIVQSRANRAAPEDDGVDALFVAHGFHCCFDACHAARNWPKGAPPPLTHWSGTCIDYTYARGLVARGVYVVPCALSDHLPVVTDWSLRIEGESAC